MVQVFGLEPSFDVPELYVSVQEGHDGVLPCSIDNLGAHKVVWTDQWAKLLTVGDQRIIDDPRISIERPFTKDWNLHIRKATYADRGQYECQINTKPVKKKLVILTVFVSSKIINELSSRDQTVREGENVTLVCNVTGNPTPDVTWYKMPNEGSQKKERIGTTGEVLIIHNVSRYCDGMYKCVAYNNFDPAVTRQMKVFVEFAPEVSLPTKRIGQYPGSETILECEITAYPHAIMGWRKGDEDIEFFNKDKYKVEVYSRNDESTRKTLTLRVRDIQEEDFGEYTCYAENSFGNDEETVILYDNSDHAKKIKSTTKEPSLFVPPNSDTNIPIAKEDRGTKTGNLDVTVVGTRRPIIQGGTNRNERPGKEHCESLIVSAKKIKSTTKEPSLFVPPTSDTNIQITKEDRGTKTGNLDVTVVGTKRPIIQGGTKTNEAHISPRPGNHDSVYKSEAHRISSCEMLWHICYYLSRARYDFPDRIFK